MRQGRIFREFAKLVTCFFIFCLTMQASAPGGWYLAGNRPSDYQTGVDTQMKYNDHSSAFLKSTKPEIIGFGTLMQNFSAEKYKGARVRFSAFVKSEDVKDWAGLWMRIDKDQKILAFDNMQDRPIKGTGDWQNYQVVLDVPSDATGVFFGVLLSGTGSIWLNDAKFEIVGSDVEVTGKKNQMPSGPSNLDFEN